MQIDYEKLPVELQRMRISMLGQHKAIGEVTSYLLDRRRALCKHHQCSTLDRLSRHVNVTYVNLPCLHVNRQCLGQRATAECISRFQFALSQPNLALRPRQYSLSAAAQVVSTGIG
jgi:hypothetical protein